MEETGEEVVEEEEQVDEEVVEDGETVEGEDAAAAEGDVAIWTN